VGTREQAHIRPKQSPGANRNGQAVNHDTVGVDEYIFANDHVEAIVCFDGWFNPGLVFEELVVCHGVIQSWWKRSLVLDDTDRTRRLDRYSVYYLKGRRGCI
jgi:hypothetical protein